MADDRARRPALAFRSILHPTDFSEASQPAFAHALKLAVVGRARLTIFHAGSVSKRRSGGWREFPGVRETLERWELLPPGSPRRAVSKLGLSVEKVAAHEDDPLEAIRRYIRAHPPELIALGTHGRHGPARWLHPAVAEPLAREARTTTLFVPRHARGFVAEADGSARLDRILVPIERPAPSQSAVNAAAAFARAFEHEKTHFALLPAHGEAPALRIPDQPGWSWERIEPRQPRVPAILEAAKRFRADLIVMTTRGREGLLEGLRGTATEQVLRRAPCPVLALPEA